MAYKRWLSYVLVLALAESPLISISALAADCQSTINELEKPTDANDKNPQCPKHQQTLNIMPAGGGSTNADAQQLNAQCATQKSQAESVKSSCEDAYSQCQEACTDDPSQCDRFQERADKASELISSSDNCAMDSGKVASNTSSEPGQNGGDQGSSGGSGGSGAGMMMAAAGLAGLLGYMLGKKSAEKNGDSADLGNGQYDCSKSDAYQYSACDSNLESTCQSDLSSQLCSNFASRYCYSSGSSSNSGSGVGTSFCKFLLATNYCKSSGRESCPSCLQLATNNSAACQQNPALCLAQNSPDQIAQAKVSCPTDPMFADPTYASGGGSQVPTQISQGGPLPTVVLPQSVDSSSTTSRSAASVASASGVRPVSDIDSRFGPSVFSVSSQVLARHCQARRYNNCP